MPLLHDNDDRWGQRKGKSEEVKVKDFAELILKQVNKYLITNRRKLMSYFFTSEFVSEGHPIRYAIKYLIQY
jgi:hypothetical protein